MGRGGGGSVWSVWHADTPSEKLLIKLPASPHTDTGPTSPSNGVITIGCNEGIYKNPPPPQPDIV